MSLTTLPPQTHPALGAVRTVGAGLAALREANLWSLSDAEVLSLRGELAGLSAQLDSAAVRATGEVDQRGAAVAAGATSTTSWRIGALRAHPGDARREVRLAAALRDLPATDAALAHGAINLAAAALIAETDHALAAIATAAERTAAEGILAEQAGLLEHRGLQGAALHLRHALDPDRGEQLTRDEQAQIARRSFRLIAHPDGSSRLDGYLDKEATALLRTALDPLAKPRVRQQDADGTAVDTVGGSPGSRDRREHAERMADALIELAELGLRSGELPAQAGQPVQVVVTVSLDDLRRAAGRAGAADLDLGLPLSVSAVRRLACDAQIIPAVLGTHGEPLDIGRATRTIPPALRRALELRDQHCAFPGCSRPPRWSHGHHIEHWSDGGATSLANTVLLCAAHHRAVHQDGWDVVIAPDGFPDFHPPPWIDPTRQPRRNLRAVLSPRGSDPP